jgi:hypothetical protein
MSHESSLLVVVGEPVDHVADINRLAESRRRRSRIRGSGGIGSPPAIYAVTA